MNAAPLKINSFLIVPHFVIITIQPTSVEIDMGWLSKTKCRLIVTSVLKCVGVTINTCAVYANLMRRMRRHCYTRERAKLDCVFIKGPNICFGIHYGSKLLMWVGTIALLLCLKFWMVQLFCGAFVAAI